MSGLKTDEKLLIPTMSATTRTVNKQTQPPSTEQQQFICRYCKKPRHVIKECQQSIQKEQGRQGENKLPKFQTQNIPTLSTLPKS